MFDMASLSEVWGQTLEHVSPQNLSTLQSRNAVYQIFAMYFVNFQIKCISYVRKSLYVLKIQKILTVSMT